MSKDFNELVSAISQSAGDIDLTDQSSEQIPPLEIREWLHHLNMVATKSVTKINEFKVNRENGFKDYSVNGLNPELIARDLLGKLKLYHDAFRSIGRPVWLAMASVRRGKKATMEWMCTRGVYALRRVEKPSYHRIAQDVCETAIIGLKRELKSQDSCGHRDFYNLDLEADYDDLVNELELEYAATFERWGEPTLYQLEVRHTAILDSGTSQQADIMERDRDAQMGHPFEMIHSAAVDSNEPFSQLRSTDCQNIDSEQRKSKCSKLITQSIESSLAKRFDEEIIDRFICITRQITSVHGELKTKSELSKLWNDASPNFPPHQGKDVRTWVNSRVVECLCHYRHNSRKKDSLFILFKKAGLGHIVDEFAHKLAHSK